MVCHHARVQCMVYHIHVLYGVSYTCVIWCIMYMCYNGVSCTCVIWCIMYMCYMVYHVHVLYGVSCTCAIWAVLSDNAPSGEHRFFEISRKRVKTDFISLSCETRHDNYFLPFSSLVDTLFI